jgi:hypothetical protein
MEAAETIEPIIFMRFPKNLHFLFPRDKQAPTAQAMIPMQMIMLDTFKSLKVDSMTQPFLKALPKFEIKFPYENPVVRREILRLISPLILATFRAGKNRTTKSSTEIARNG